MTKINCSNPVFDTEINVEGVVADRKQAANDEIRWYLQLFSTISKGLQLEVPLRRVVVAGDFDAKINELWPVCKASGVEYKVEYKSKMNVIGAAAKALRHIENENISFSLVFNGELFGSWEEKARAFRFETFLHEFVHTILDCGRFKRVGAEKFYPGEKTAEGVCLSLALDTRDEYVVDRIVDGLCQEFLVDDNGRHLQLADVWLAGGTDLRASLLELTKRMSIFVSQNVTDFRLCRINIGTLWRNMLQFIEELLIVFAHCAATYDRREEWHKLFADMSARDAYNSFLIGGIEAVHREWQKWFDEPNFDEEISLSVIQREMEAILRKCGLTLTNVAEGIYVKVDQV